MKNKQVIVGTVLSYFTLAVQSLSLILTTPFIIARIGDGAFGVYKIVSSLIAYMGVLNFGFGNAAVRFLAELRVKNNKDKENELLSVIKLLNLAAIIVAAVVGVIVYLVIPQVFSASLTTGEILLSRQMFAVLVASVVVNISNDIYAAVINVHERFIFIKTVDLIRCILRVTLVFSILTLNSSALLLTGIDLLMSLFIFACNYIYCRRALRTTPHYSLRPLKALDKAYYRKVLSYASFYFLNLIIDQLIWNTDSVIIGIRLSSFQAAVYGSGSTISSAFYSLSLVVGTLMFPKVVRLVTGKASTKEMTDIMIRISRFQAYISLFIVTAYWVFGKQFVLLWLGEHYEAAWLASLLTMIGTLFNSLTASGHLILRALNRQKFFLFTELFIFLLNAVATYIIVPATGIIGAAFMTMASFIIGVTCILLPYYKKVIGLEIGRFLKSIFPQIIVSVLLGGTAFWFFRVISITSWLSLGVYIVLYGFVYFLFLYLLATPPEEKVQIKAAITRLLHREGRKQ